MGESCLRRGGPRARPLLATASPAEHQQKVGRRCCNPAVEAAGPSRNSRKSAFCRADRPCIRATNVCRALARPPAARLRCAEGSGTRRPPQSPGSAFVGLTNAHKRRGGRRCLPSHLIHRRRPADDSPPPTGHAPAAGLLTCPCPSLLVRRPPHTHHVLRAQRERLCGRLHRRL